MPNDMSISYLGLLILSPHGFEDSFGDALMFFFFSFSWLDEPEIVCLKLLFRASTVQIMQLVLSY
jgi:hypothetical protein